MGSSHRVLELPPLAEPARSHERISTEATLAEAEREHILKILQETDSGPRSNSEVKKRREIVF